MHINPLRTEAVCVLNVHCGVDAVFSGLIAARGDDAPLLRQGSDDERFANA